MSKKNFPKTIYVNINTEDDGDPPFLIAHRDRDSALNASEDGELVAVYELTFVGRVSVDRDLKTKKSR